MRFVICCTLYSRIYSSYHLIRICTTFSLNSGFYMLSGQFLTRFSQHFFCQSSCEISFILRIGLAPFRDENSTDLTIREGKKARVSSIFNIFKLQYI
jgi:hypothetical protein